MSIHNLVEEVKLKKSGTTGDAQREAYAIHVDSVHLAINGLILRFEAAVGSARSLSVTDKETLSRFIGDAKDHADALAEAVTANPSMTARDAEVDRHEREEVDRTEREKAYREREQNKVANAKAAPHA